MRTCWLPGAREHRAAVWSDHELPVVPTDKAVSLIVSAIPEEPLVELLDLRTLEPMDLCPPPPLLRYLKSVGPGIPLDYGLTRWADGFCWDDISESGLPNFLRVHRDGAAGFSTPVSR